MAFHGECLRSEAGSPSQSSAEAILARDFSDEVSCPIDFCHFRLIQLGDFVMREGDCIDGLEAMAMPAPDQEIL